MKKAILLIMGLFAGLSTYAQKNYLDTDASGFEKLIASDTVILLDVRTPQEFNDGHIKGATLIDFKEADHLDKAKNTLNKNKRIAIYCRSGRRSAAFAFQLAAEGYRVTNLFGGIIQWQNQGKTVVK